MFPYDYISSAKKLLDTKLADKSQFYNKLQDENVENLEYEHAVKVWDNFNIESLFHNVIFMGESRTGIVFYQLLNCYTK